MIGTILGILVSLLVYYYPVFTEQSTNLNLLIPIFIVIPFLFLILETLCNALAWPPLQKASNSITPHLLNLYTSDIQFTLVKGWLFIFALASVFISLKIQSLTSYYQNILIVFWVILFGISFDVMQHGIKRVLNYFNPFSVLDLFERTGIKNIQNEKEIDLCDQFDSLTESATKGIEQKTPFVTNYALNVIQNLSKVFLESSKNITQLNSDSQTKSLGIQDKVTYTLSYLFQRIDYIFHQALDSKLETVLSSLITTMAKISISSAHYDISICPHPLIYLGKFAVKSLENKFTDVGVRSTLTLVEIAKTILSEIDLTYLEIQETFLCLIGQLESIAKETFKQDKNIKIMVLAQPFIKLKELFKAEKMINHQDVAVISTDLDRIIGELQILENVMRTMPPLPPLNPEEKK